MATATLAGFLRRLHDAAPTDNELLEEFARRRDTAAFEALVHRHGPMVLGVCRRVLGNEADAEDAFQAVFLVLVRKAPALHPRKTLGNWLYGVACRVALKAKLHDRRRRESDRRVAERPEPQATDVSNRDLREVLDHELQALPEHYRVAIVLCDLERRSIREAATQLNCPEGTVGARLSRGRELLAGRLQRRGLCATATIAAALAEATASAGVPAVLKRATVTAVKYLAGEACAISPNVLKLTEEVMKGMLLTKVKMAAAAAIAVCVLGVAAAWAAQPATSPVRAKEAGVRGAALLAASNAAKDDGWGKPDGGVKIRTRVEQKAWRADETPKVSLDLDNVNGGALVVRRLPVCEIEVDGKWYVQVLGQPVAGAVAVRQGDTSERFAVVSLEGSKWVLKSAVKTEGKTPKEVAGDILRAAADHKNRLELAPGKHTIRVMCGGISSELPGGGAGPKLEPVSNGVEVEITKP